MAAKDAADAEAAALSRVQALLAAGDFAALLDAGLREALHRAAAEAGLEAEIGALRLALAVLLQEERDPSRLASGVARVAAVAVQAARLRQGASEAGDDLAAVLARELAVLDAEATAGDLPADTGEEEHDGSDS
ncbi:MAG: hypothetical protein KC442_05165 [Thermomicrobiales bacterium]|nr:hypothetical protein [Thermomicrobiales bacterium]